MNAVKGYQPSNGILFSFVDMLTRGSSVIGTISTKCMTALLVVGEVGMAISPDRSGAHAVYNSTMT